MLVFQSPAHTEVIEFVCSFPLGDSFSALFLHALVVLINLLSSLQDP